MNSKRLVPVNLFRDWVSKGTSATVPVYREQTGTRELGLSELKRLVANHFVGDETILKMGGYEKAAKTIQNSLPTRKRIRSGDLGELLATEFVDSETTFRVPIRKLRWKSDREMPMHGNDVIAVDVTRRTKRVLKVESKSRARFTAQVVEEAVTGLEGHGGRPNPSTLAFIIKRLYEEDRDQEARIFENLQVDGALAARNIDHLIFALSGNDPAKPLAAAPKPKNSAMGRSCAAVVIHDHSEFIDAVYGVNGTKR